MVAEIMTRDVATLDESDNLLNLLETMKALRFRHMPVTDASRLVGLLTERDVLRFSSSSLLPNRAESDRLLQRRYFVRDVMQRDVVTATPEMPLRQAARLMLKHRIDCLPVVDADNVLIGIVTSSDFVELTAELAAEE